MFCIFYLWVHTQSLVNKSLKLTLIDPIQGHQGRDQNNFAVALPFYESNPHTKSGWISSNGLGEDNITDRQQDGILFWPLNTPKSHP